MTDDSEKALYKICAELQKEIRDLKHDDDSHCLAIGDLTKKVDNFDNAITRRLDSNFALSTRVYELEDRIKKLESFDDSNATILHNYMKKTKELENMVKAIFNLLAK